MKIKIFALIYLFCFATFFSTAFCQNMDPLRDDQGDGETEKSSEIQHRTDNDQEEKKQTDDSKPEKVPEKLTLTEAYMCEAVKNFAPVNPAIVFSISGQSVCCFSAFDPVPEKTIVYHKWYRKDRLSTTQSLSLEPPRWSTYSSIQLREADKGPWQVEIIGPKGQIMKILRFSVTD